MLQSLAIVLAGTAFIGVAYTFAQPTAAPPGASVPLPVNVGAGAQTKAGALTIQGALTATGGLAVSGGSGLCINGVCKTTWPSASIQSGSVNITPVAYQAGYNSSQQYENYTVTYYTYYGNQQVYTNGGYYSTSNFQITHNSGISSGVVVSATTPVVRCYSTSYQGSNNYTPAYYAYGQSSPYTYATSVTTSISGASVIVSGTCKYYTNNGYYGVAVPDAFSAIYIY